MPGSLDRPAQPHAPDQPDQPDANDTPRQLRPATPQSDLSPNPDHPDQTGPADRSAATDQRVPWSRADLQQRLERLPPGHPSSPPTAELGRNQPSGLRDLDALSPQEETEQDSDRRPEATTPDHARSDIRDGEPAAPDNAENGTQEADGGRDGLDRQPDAVKRDYWGEVPRFLRTWADHLRRWPAERQAAAVDRSRDPAGSWRGDGNQYLNPEQHAQAKDVIAGVQRAEETLTKDMTKAERENPSGGWLAGMEFRRKGEDRLKEKIAERLEHEPERMPAGVMRQINDAIRYTFCFEPTSYSDGYRDVIQRLHARGYQMVYSENHWRDDPEYKGINTRWITPEDQRFEVQFHTAESFHAKQQVTHGSYERLRNPLTDDDERRELRAFQRDVCYRITIPEGATAIADYRRKGHN